MGVRTKTSIKTVTNQSQCRTEVLSQQRRQIYDYAIRLWNYESLVYLRSREFWCSVTYASETTDQNALSKKCFRLSRRFFTLTMYLLTTLMIVLIIVSFILAATVDPYSRGNRSFHEKTMYANFIRQRKHHSEAMVNASETLRGVSPKRSHIPLSFGDSMVRPTQSTRSGSGSKPPPIKFFWGIMSTLSDEDKIRRSVIRQTYLNFYKDAKSLNTPHRICSLTAYRSNSVPRNECEIIYAFIVGGGDTDDFPKDLVDEAPNILPLELDRSSEDEEDDLIYLNIRENQFEGKMQSYFKWVTTLLANNTLSVDYIAKVDSDTILYPPRWFSFVESSLLPPPYNRRVYGGRILDRVECGGLRKWHCRQMVNLNYMSGELYFLSTDLAEFIVSDRLGTDKRRSNQYFTEDLTIGNFVHLYPDGPIHQVLVTKKFNLWSHGMELKNPVNYVRKWEDAKDTWLLDPDMTKETENEWNDNADGDIANKYEQFLSYRWSLRAMIDDLYRVYVPRPKLDLP